MPPSTSLLCHLQFKKVLKKYSFHQFFKVIFLLKQQNEHDLTKTERIWKNINVKYYQMFIFNLKFSAAETFCNGQLAPVLSADGVDFVFQAITCTQHFQLCAPLLHKLLLVYYCWHMYACRVDLIVTLCKFFSPFGLILCFMKNPLYYATFPLSQWVA